MKKGFATTIPQETALREYGLPAKDIYLERRGGESLDAAIQSFRGKPGELLVAFDLRILGSKRKLILAATDKIEAAGLKLIDIRDEKASLSKLLEIAIGKTAGDARRKSAGKSLNSAGRRGGRAKATSQELRRAAVAHEDVVRRLCAHPKLSWRDCSDILGGNPFSVATLRRRYGPER